MQKIRNQGRSRSRIYLPVKLAEGRVPIKKGGEKLFLLGLPYCQFERDGWKAESLSWIISWIRTCSQIFTKFSF